MDQLFLMERIENTRQTMEKSNWKVFVRTQSYLKPYVVPYVFFVFVSGLGQFLTFSSVGVFERNRIDGFFKYFRFYDSKRNSVFVCNFLFYMFHGIWHFEYKKDRTEN